MVGSIGPLATINREPGQVRKEAAVAVVLCAGVWLIELASSLKIHPEFYPKQRSF